MEKFKTKKSLGQNFLQDQQIISAIIETSKLEEGEKILEIGPGQGALTDRFVRANCDVEVIELDQRLIGVLEKRYVQYSKIKILHKDFLETTKEDFAFLDPKQSPIKMIANLPYYITTPIIIKSLIKFPFIETMIVMVQKEVGLRFSSEYKNKNYGSVTVFLQTLANLKYEFTVPKTAFEPEPKIDSAIISLKRKKDIDPIIKKSVEDYSEFLKRCFAQKRKVLSNNLKEYNGKNKNEIEVFLKNLGYPLTIRPEEIKVEEYIELYKNWKKFIK